MSDNYKNSVEYNIKAASVKIEVKFFKKFTMDVGKILGKSSIGNSW